MSFTSELNICGAVVSQEIITKSNFIERMESELEQCIAPSKQESIRESTVVNEEIVVNTNRHLSDKADHQTESTMYFEESLESCSDMAVRFEESIDTVPLSEGLPIAKKWDFENIKTSPLKENESEKQEDEEETIATFVTTEGQQLALYAVEDMDEIFAVAVYNESEPPSNFQFLMKADVERLIGEGAVRTVKKPSKMKKRVFTAQPPMFYRKEESEMNKTSTCNALVNSKKGIAQEENGIERNYETYQNYSGFKINHSKSSDSVHETVDEQSDITYLMMDDNFVNIVEQPDECQDDLEFEDELMEYSTVQYILLEADHQSDSELTFDEIQTTLQNMKISRKKSFETNGKKSGKSQGPQSNIQEDRTLLMKDKSLNEDTGELESYMASLSTADRTCTSISENDRQRLIDTLTDFPPSTTATTPQTPLKVKRSRKQQLISVDRDDGEIIIQPASILNEELTGKKRTTRRRQLSSHIRVTVTNTKRIKRTKQIKRTKRRKVVEVIDLDVDEEEQHTTRNVVEITLDDNKDKYSSDKENEIIMVRDSDSDDSDDEGEEEEEKNEWQPSGHLTKLNGVIRCEYCSRNFRYRRTLNTHLLVCQKSPTKTLNLAKRKGKENQKVKKQFTCKICQEKFDVVVALARHARAVHSQRKRHKLSLSPAKTPSKSLRSVQRKETTSTEEEGSVDEDNTTKRELSMLARVKRKRKQRNSYSLETKKLNCTDCGRWFPSTALLDAHSLQHGTKRSEQLRKCHICKKLIKSRLLFLQHLKMHNDTQRNSSRMLRRKLRARPNTRKITSPRKRGRPRKF